MTEDEIQKRTNQAIAYFESGYNCSQAVFMAYADLYDVNSEIAAIQASSFGGGMGRLREVCGAVTGMFLVMSYHYPSADPSNKIAKNTNYEAVQRTAELFRKRMGSYICADLLKIKREPEPPQASDRTEKYYQLRPCSRCVAIAAEITGYEINKQIRE